MQDWYRVPHGYQTFETEINPLAKANQKVEIRTELVKTGAPPAGPLVKTETSDNDTKPPSVVREATVSSHSVEMQPEAK
jgi:hypothetical protein